MQDFVPDPKLVMQIDGNAYALNDDTLMVAPVKIDNTVDDAQWTEYQSSSCVDEARFMLHTINALRALAIWRNV